MKEKQTLRNVSIILSSLTVFHHTLISKNPGFNLSKIDPLYTDLMEEISKQGHALIEVSKIIPAPRSKKALLEQLVEDEVLTTEVLEEIKRALKEGEK